MSESDDAAVVFEEFSRTIGTGPESPYPLFAELRAAGAVHVGMPELGITEHMEGMPPQFSVYSYDAVAEVLADPEAYSSAAYSGLIGVVMGRSLIEMDPPEHRGYRLILQQAFARSAMTRWREELVDPLLDEMVGTLAAEGRAELVSRLLFTFPVRTIAGMIGLPAESFPLFHRLAIELIALTIDWARAERAAATLGELFAEVLAERRREPRDDMMSALAFAEHDGHRLTDEEIFSFLRLLLPAGAETTYRSSSSLLLALLTQRDQFDLLLAEPGRIGAAVDEGVRWETPLLVSPRTATRDTVLAGTEIPAGANLTLSLGSANHDEKRWEDPERFDLSRPRQAHIGFGLKSHMCLGQHLAKMETEALVDALVRRLPGIRLDPDAEPPFIAGSFLRSPPRLDVVWDA
jgi:cytochrome P450